MDQDNSNYSYIEIIKAVFGILLIFGSLYGIYSYVDWRIDRKINSPAFIHKIASNVRPSVVFNSEESIEIDLGAMQLIENIKVTPSEESRFPKTITVSPNQYLAHAPFLSSLDKVEFHMQIERGKKYDWVYHLVLSSHPDYINKTRFRLEILQ